MKIGDKVKFNIEELQTIGWEGLQPEHNTNGKNYANYILSNIDKVYCVKSFDDNQKDATIILDDQFLQSTTFSEKELIVISG